MRLYSIQPWNVVDELLKNHYFVCDIDKSELISDDVNDMFKNAYNWLVNQMNNCINNPDNIKYPIWAWYKYDGSNDLPDFNQFNNYSDKENFLLVIDIPDDDVFLTDYSDWHCVLNNGYNNQGITDEEYDKLWDIYDKSSVEQKEKIKLDSWNDIILNKNSDNKFIQATFWKLTEDMVLDIIQIAPSIDIDNLIDDIKYAIEENNQDYINDILFDDKYKNIDVLLDNYIINYKNHSGLSLDEFINSYKIPDELNNKINFIKNFFNKDKIREFDKEI